MENYINIETIKVLIDYIILGNKSLTVDSVLKELMELEYGNKKVITLENGAYLSKTSAEILKRVLDIYERAYEEIKETIQDLSSSANKEEMEDLLVEDKEEFEKMQLLLQVLKGMTNENVIYHEPNDEYVFITIDDPNKKGKPILDGDVPPGEEEVTLTNLERTEIIGTSQLETFGELQLVANGNGFHPHAGKKVYKNIGDNIRIQVEYAGKGKKVIAVLAVTPPSKTHKNNKNDVQRTDDYLERGQDLENYLATCPKDQNGQIEANELKRLQKLYTDYKKNLKAKKPKRKSGNISALEELCKNIKQNIENQEKVM